MRLAKFLVPAVLATVYAVVPAQAATIASNGSNHSFADAMLVPSGYFTTIINGAIELSDSLPNASAVGFSSGLFDYYKFTTTSAGTIILDIDYTYSYSGNPGPFDPMVALWKADGTLVDANDDRDTVDVGSSHSWDSYLNKPDMAAGTYVVGVARFQGDWAAADGGWTLAGAAPIPENSFYTLHISAPVPEPETWGLMLAGLGLIASIGRRRLFS